MPEFFPKDTRNYSVANKFTAYISEKNDDGTFEPYLPLGNIVDSTLSTELVELEHFSNFNGIDRKDLEVVLRVGGTFNWTVDEMVCHVARWLFGSSTRTTGATLLVPHTETQKFTGSGTVITVNGGAAFDSNVALVDEDCTLFVDGVDYTVQAASGTYLHAASGAIPVSGTVRAIFNTSETGAKYPLLDKPNIEARVKLVNLAPEIGPKFMMEINRVRLRLDGDVSFSKEDWRTAVLQGEMLEDENGNFGFLYQGF